MALGLQYTAPPNSQKGWGVRLCKSNLCLSHGVRKARFGFGYLLLCHASEVHMLSFSLKNPSAKIAFEFPSTTKYRVGLNDVVVAGGMMESMSSAPKIHCRCEERISTWTRVSC